MSKNNNVIQLFFYLIICLSIGFLIYNSCKNKIVEGFEESQNDTENNETSEEKSFQNFNNAMYSARTGLVNDKYSFKWDNNAAKNLDGFSLEAKKKYIDFSGSTLDNNLKFVQDERELLRLMGINEMATSWNSLNPDFMKFYKDKMFFLNDIEKYIIQSCMKSGISCNGSSTGGGGSGNWWQQLSNSGKGASNWWQNISDATQKDWKGFQTDLNNMDNKN